MRDGSLKNIPVSLLLLAGGCGSRMGGNKLYASVDGVFLVERIFSSFDGFFSEFIFLVACGERERAEEFLSHWADKYDFLVVEDCVSGVGPLEGLARGLEVMSCDWGFLLGCDMPFASPDVVRSMFSFVCDDFDVVVSSRGGFLEPLHAFYSKSCLCAVRDSVSCGKRSLRSFFSDVSVCVLDVSDFASDEEFERSFFNLNCPSDLEVFRTLL
ncbi:MAG: molybdenum cofactor guanylyltransferase [Synergistaceae bacterium]